MSRNTASGRNTVSADTVADFFLLQMDRNAGDTISQLKLQKLCYYAQAWHLAVFGEPLFGEPIEAWAHGPVVPSLYSRFRSYRWDAIDPSEAKTDPYEDLHSDHLELLEAVFEKYGSLTAKQLERLTHSEAPWRDAYGDTPQGRACDEEITHEAMKTFYRKQLRRRKK